MTTVHVDIWGPSGQTIPWMEIEEALLAAGIALHNREVNRRTGSVEVDESQADRAQVIIKSQFGIETGRDGELPAGMAADLEAWAVTQRAGTDPDGQPEISPYPGPTAEEVFQRSLDN